MGLYDWNTPQSFTFGDNWGALPQFQNIAGYGVPSTDVPLSGGLTSQGGPSWGDLGDVTDSAIAKAGPDFWDKMFGYTDTTNGFKYNGMAGAGLGLLQGGLNAFMGMKHYGLMKDQLAFNKKAFKMNFDNQVLATNTALEDRQRARVASREGATSSPYQSIGDYMNEHRVA